MNENQTSSTNSTGTSMGKQPVHQATQKSAEPQETSVVTQCVTRGYQVGIVLALVGIFFWSSSPMNPDRGHFLSARSVMLIFIAVLVCTLGCAGIGALVGMTIKKSLKQ